jgi:hypothetical protein
MVAPSGRMHDACMIDKFVDTGVSLPKSQDLEKPSGLFPRALLATNIFAP